MPSSGAAGQGPQDGSLAVSYLPSCNISRAMTWSTAVQLVGILGPDELRQRNWLNLIMHLTCDALVLMRVIATSLVSPLKRRGLRVTEDDVHMPCDVRVALGIRTSR